MLLQLQGIGGKISMSRIQKAFENGPAFISFLTAGDPSLDKTIEYMKTMEKAGASLIEIGIPFSDPIAEGPVIQEASVRALKNNVSVDDVFEIVKTIRTESDIPLCLMGYLNPVFHYGYDAFFQKCQKVGVDGVIIPDLPFEEKHEVEDIASQYGIDVISLIAPTSKKRIKMIAKEAKGFIYLVSSMGVTGTRTTIDTDIESIVKDIKTVTDVPVAVGFGIHDTTQAHDIAQKSDGIIVGSAIVKIIAKEGHQAQNDIYEYVYSMVEATKK